MKKECPGCSEQVMRFVSNSETISCDGSYCDQHLIKYREYCQDSLKFLKTDEGKIQEVEYAFDGCPPGTSFIISIDGFKRYITWKEMLDAFEEEIKKRNL